MFDSILPITDLFVPSCVFSLIFYQAWPNIFHAVSGKFENAIDSICSDAPYSSVLESLPYLIARGKFGCPCMVCEWSCQGKSSNFAKLHARRLTSDEY